MNKKPVNSGPTPKMVIVVRKDLRMGAGKVAAQAAHAAVRLYASVCSRPGACNRWQNTGEKKVVLRVESEKQFDEVARHARQAGLPVAVIRDAGRTQVNASSKTALSILGNGDIVDKITGHLRLF